MEEVQIGDEKTLNAEQNHLNILDLAYKVNNDEPEVRLFGDIFVENNKDNFKLFIDGNEVEFNDVYQTHQIEEGTNILKVTLKQIKPTTDYSFLFFRCDSLLFFYNPEKMNLDKVTNISHLFAECKTHTYLPDISSWDTSNITIMDSLFFKCQSLLVAPDISNWNTKNVTTI